MIYLGGIGLKQVGKLIAASNYKDGSLQIRSIKNFNKILNMVTADDTAVLYDYRYRKLAELISDKCITYPNKKALLFCGDRGQQIRYTDSHGLYPIQRNYHSLYRSTTKHGYVYKIGNKHAGDGKLLGDGTMLVTRESVIEEEYIEGRSIRVLWIHPGTVYVIEHVNTKNWISNINPDREIVYNKNQIGSCKVLSSIVDSTTSFVEHNMIAQGIISLTWGFDYIVGQKTGLLEINDMCGLPDSEEVSNSFVESVLSVC